MKSLNFSAVIFLFCMCKTPELKDNSYIRLNQLGYYPNSAKHFVLVGHEAESFIIKDDNDEKVFNGQFTKTKIWEESGEQTQKGDFTALTTPGKYRIIVKGVEPSYEFEISEGLYEDVLIAALKSNYFQRVSAEIPEEYGGKYARALGHPDDSCLFHPSSGKTEGYMSSPGGWYDAGDYNKYIVNAALSAGQIMDLYVLHPDVLPDNSVNIPESGNGISDLLDEIKYETDWVKTMQDDDGGVFFKLTTKNFEPFVMPHECEQPRYIVGKGTASSLAFAAIMAKTSRIFSGVDTAYANSCLDAAEEAFSWALQNDDIPYSNPEDIKTGEYGDDYFNDDFFWAASELWATTKQDEYLSSLIKYQEDFQHQLTNSWKFFVRNMAFHTLVANAESLPDSLSDKMISGQIKIADDIIQEIKEHPYHIALNRFEWGSNSDVLNQAMILCFAHELTGEKKYLKGAVACTDYIFGKNATGYSFVTGYGDKTPMNIHHRPSVADGIKEPVPGFVVGGPNHHKQDRNEVDYDSEEPAKSFVDQEGSYASNEVCLNWNAPLIFVLGYLENNME